MSSFVDPENSSEILESLTNIATLGEVHELVQKIFPSWIVGALPAYSRDYQQTQNNWEIMCVKLNVKPTQVLCVEDFAFDDNHTLIRTFAEIFTRSGFSVRRKSEIVPCEGCGLAIPSPTLYEIMKENGNPVPQTWSNRCSTCLKLEEIKEHEDEDEKN